MAAEVRSFLTRTDLRVFGAAISIAVWLVLLFTGWAIGGLVHVLVVLALFVFPWRAVPRQASPAKVVDSSEQAIGKRRDRQSD